MWHSRRPGRRSRRAWRLGRRRCWLCSRSCTQSTGWVRQRRRLHVPCSLQQGRAQCTSRLAPDIGPTMPKGLRVVVRLTCLLCLTAHSCSRRTCSASWWLPTISGVRGARPSPMWTSPTPSNASPGDWSARCWFSIVCMMAAPRDRLHCDTQGAPASSAALSPAVCRLQRSCIVTCRESPMYAVPTVVRSMHGRCMCYCRSAGISGQSGAARPPGTPPVAPLAAGADVQLQGGWAAASHGQHSPINRPSSAQLRPPVSPQQPPQHRPTSAI